MTTMVKRVNFLVARSALTHRQFQALLEELDSTKDILDEEEGFKED